jgi:hypothetical protein
MGGIHSPTALLSMISCALVLAAMIVFGLAERAPLKKLRMKLMVGECGVVGGRVVLLNADSDSPAAAEQPSDDAIA